jgi:pimeloyl-ACP methyl ester carboxylesterase
VGLAAFGRRRRSWLRATSPSLELLLRVWSLARDGATISRDLSAGRFPPIPTIVVSAGVHGPTSLSRRTHERIAASIPDAQLEVWDGTDHSLHVQQPERVRGAVLALLERLSDERRSPSSRS